MPQQIAKNRKSILFLLFIGYTIASMDRFFINYAILPIAGDLQLTASQTGMVLSAFFLGYAIMQMPGGWLADRFGARITIFACIIAWSIFTGLTGIAWSLAAILIIRFIFGLGEGGFIPASAKMIADSYPMENRSRAMSLLLTAAAVAGVITPIMSAVLIVSIGWRQLFFIFGVVGIVMALLIWFFLKPKYVIVGNESQISEKPRLQQQRVPISVLLKTPMLWSLLIASFAVFSINWGTASWIPTYLVQTRGLDMTTLGFLQMVPAASSIIFMLIAGYLVDKLFAGKERLLGIICGTGLTLLVYLMFNATTIMMFITYQSLLPIFTGTAIVLVTTLPLKKLPESVGGTAVGMVQFGGQFAGFVAPLAIGFFVDAFNGSYTGAIWLLISFGILYIVSISTLQFSKGAIFSKPQPQQPPTIPTEA